MFYVSYEVKEIKYGNKISNGKRPKNRKMVLLETDKYVYGATNYNPFLDFCSKVPRDKYPEWFNESYKVRNLGNFMFWRGTK